MVYGLIPFLSTLHLYLLPYGDYFHIRSLSRMSLSSSFSLNAFAEKGTPSFRLWAPKPAISRRPIEHSIARTHARTTRASNRPKSLRTSLREFKFSLDLNCHVIWEFTLQLHTTRTSSRTLVLCSIHFLIEPPSIPIIPLRPRCHRWPRTRRLRTGAISRRSPPVPTLSGSRRPSLSSCASESTGSAQEKRSSFPSRLHQSLPPMHPQPRDRQLSASTRRMSVLTMKPFVAATRPSAPSAPLSQRINSSTLRARLRPRQFGIR
ncbi:hypothetical protein K438DRAFT_606301 [Mycena galopus ATCC 62051]|nr:hypothetical protein K438DRAFT_606301 [Mycena galopus ATCC 62051]